MLFVVDTNYIYISSPHYNCTFIMYIYMDFYCTHYGLHFKCTLEMLFVVDTCYTYISSLHVDCTFMMYIVYVHFFDNICYAHF